ncbi:MAG: hypothetical protein ABI577_15330 [bacterium]
MRVSPPKVFPIATAATKPPADAAGSADAFRQTGFVLGADVEAVMEGLNLEGAAAEVSSGSKFRSQTMASALGLWSRSWLCRLEALHAVQWGNYSAAITLIRGTADYQASQLYLLRTSAAEWTEWLDAGGIAIAAEEHATEFRLHPFRAAEILAEHPVLGRIYRTAMDLSLSHFGSTMLFAGSGSAPDHVEVTFGDRDFHSGLAELELGWLLELGSAQLATVAEFESVFGPVSERSKAWTGAAEKLTSQTSRCRIETKEIGGERRYVVQNWRREPRSAAKRLLL